MISASSLCLFAIVIARSARAATTESLCTRFYDGTNTEKSRLADEIVAAARAEANLPPLAPGQAMAKARPFFMTHHGSTMCDGGFAYRTVWKGGNNFIRDNMANICNSTSETCDHHACEIEPEDAFIFSFVRDPFSHFVSGYREATSRTFQSCCDIPSNEGDEPTSKVIDNAEDAAKCKYDCSLFSGEEQTKQLAKAFVYDLLELRLLHDDADFLHVALMSANLFSDSRLRRPDFIGALETIDEDWSRMCATGLCPEHLKSYDDLDRQIGQHHASSSDQYGHGAGLKKLFEEEPHLERAVRKLLSLDEDCLHEALESKAHQKRRALAVLEDGGEVVLEKWLER